VSEVRTPRLVLRRFSPDDGPGLHAVLRDPEVVRFEPYGPVDAAEAARLAAERADDPSFWAICLAEGALVGNLYLHLEEPAAWRTYELGYVLGRDHWGHGYATEACLGLLDDVFAGGAHRVVAHCDLRNVASWRLLERLGMRREGEHRAATSFADDEAGRPIWTDGYAYAVLDEEWAARP
jgi:RimJ/RimL family protein N-acetyltransferase